MKFIINESGCYCLGPYFEFLDRGYRKPSLETWKAECKAKQSAEKVIEISKGGAAEIEAIWPDFISVRATIRLVSALSASFSRFAPTLMPVSTLFPSASRISTGIHPSASQIRLISALSASFSRFAPTLVPISTLFLSSRLIGGPSRPKQ
ncbi:hypothetical protein FE784_03955 [Paenibacillus hemerocallicola]|uniref:Uncharacterized protein n=1 Tax=Paenibacillus hemerocallicola TaxID=1172614 RepID=A0A5C4TEI8_9BACL|nr:hypothetical protein [Paenibacillus hemerocallicola]TNJ67543.1 hypothetical protein FE784_03955 [Paenibacillus hemerocallicola]